MVQEVTSKSWGSRIISSFVGIIIGIALIIGAFVLIFWNESHGLHMAQSLEQTQKMLITVPSTPIDAKNNGHAVYVTGLATTNNILKDDLFGVEEKAIKLNRSVQMYQWQENTETRTESKLGGSEEEVKTYTYKPVWSDTVIDSTEFKDQTGHENPASMPVHAKKQTSKQVTVGDFTLSPDLITDIAGETPVNLAESDLSKLKSQVKKSVQFDTDGLYIGENSESPKVGDMRINVTVVEPQTVSIIAEQNNRSLQTFVAPAGQSIRLLAMGTVSSQQMIDDAISSNTLITWLLRLASLAMMVFGISLLMGPLVVLADVIPFLGSLVGVGTFLIAFIGGLVLWSIALAIAWFTVRPLWAIGLLVVVGVVCYLLVKRRKA